MSAPFIIIDGYNLLHAAGLSQARYAPGDLNRQRHRLLVRLAQALTAAERVRCTVVFDAKDAPSGLDPQRRHAEMTVQFAEPGHDADTLIEALIDAHHAPTQLLVVSSDHRLQKAAKHRHAKSLGSDDFLSELANRARAATRSAEPTAKPASNDVTATADDVSFWMAEFGEIDVEAIATSDDPDRHGPQDPWKQEMDELQRRLDQDTDLDDWLNRPPESK